MEPHFFLGRGAAAPHERADGRFRGPHKIYRFMGKRSGHGAEKPGRVVPWRDLNAMRRDTFSIPRSPRRPAPRSLTAKMAADFLRRRSGHAAEKPGRIEPWRDLNAMRRDTSPNPRSLVPPPFRAPFPNRKNVRRLFAEEEQSWNGKAQRMRWDGSGMHCDEVANEAA